MSELKGIPVVRESALVAVRSGEKYQTPQGFTAIKDGIKTQGETAPIRSLSGGNVQRAVLARELAGEIRVLIAANPVFGLDFAAVQEIHSRILQVRERGGAVLLVSEDLDELLELADRIVVMSEGRIVHETRAEGALRQELGAHMGGGHAADATPASPHGALEPA